MRPSKENVKIKRLVRCNLNTEEKFSLSLRRQRLNLPDLLSHTFSVHKNWSVFHLSSLNNAQFGLKRWTWIQFLRKETEDFIKW